MEILLEGMEFHAFHGFYPEENRIGTRYTVDLRLTVPDSCGKDDDLEKTVNYESVYKIVHREMMQQSKLIEDVSQRIRKAILSSFPLIENVEITLYKYNPPLGGKINRVGIHLK